MGRWLAVALLTLACPALALSAEQQPEQPDQGAAASEKGGKKQVIAKPEVPLLKAPLREADRKKVREPQQNDRGDNAGPEWLAANAARDSADAAIEANRLTICALILSLLTVAAASLAAWYARQASKEARRGATAATQSFEAFVSAEDAHFVVEFPYASKLEYRDEQGQERTHFDMHIRVTNIGRSTARIEGWIVGEKRHSQEHTLVPGATWDGLHDIPVDVLAGEIFSVTILYSSPLRQRLAMDVMAELFVRRRANGAESIFGKVRNSLLRQAA